jgi:streptomycin 6-kinase
VPAAELALPDDFVQTIKEVHGPVGYEWLQALPDLLAQCEERWSLTIGLPFAPLSYNYVAPAVRADGQRVVVKAGVPCPEIITEIDALKTFDAQGAVRLLDADPSSGVLLLERLEPGKDLLSIADDAEAAALAAEVMRLIRQPVPAAHAFPSVAEWFMAFGRLRRDFGGSTGPLPARMVEEAERISAELIASAPESFLLHGDLHHGNLLTAERRSWLAIDPKGVIGDPAFEPSAFLLNPSPQPLAVLARRVEIFADMLEVPRERIAGWGTARAVLSACWMVEDHGHGWESAIRVAETLSALRI